MTQFKIFKKFKRLKLFEPSPGVLGCFFFTVCLFLCLFLLDYRKVNKGPHLYHQTSLFATLIGLNGSSVPYNKIEKLDFLEKGAESCDLFYENWVWDEIYPLYKSKDCKFLDEGFRCSENGRPDNFYTKWHWQPKDCKDSSCRHIIRLVCS
ncbi:protein trichome birefringence-like 11 [Nicotiana tabacum]|uniref:Protein trichome birefringence-like 11 n=1 Tax=Nicotiana tabacum TaxID=4097 RepID=A0AC58TQG5_TOBAC